MNGDVGMLSRIKNKICMCVSDMGYIVLNYFVNNIPCWFIRKQFYRLFGMSIGSNARIHMKCVVLAPKKISIGTNTIINEHCFLDGRGGLKIGNNCSISIYSMMITGSHSKSSTEFSYRAGEINIGDNVWLGARTIILESTRISDKAIIGAGCVFKGLAEKNSVYFGNPSRKMGDRGLSSEYDLTFRPFFR